MSRWKQLPAELHPHVHQLVVRLRRLKDHGGLSVRQLAAKTGYSAKSWERYLNGRSLPPREAVEAMARIAGDDPARLLVLHEVASEHWGKTRGTAPVGPEAAEEEPRPGRSPRVGVVAAAVALVLVVSGVVLVAARFTGGSDGGGHGSGAAAATATTPATSASRPPQTYTCRVERSGGRWYAGNSRTQEAILAYGHAGPEVAEAQCLLARAGISPGVVDGIYGPRTQRAVKRVQQRDGLVVDGIVGPHTWKALRGVTPP
ncbi:peptidoglycan-binding protein [Streptomyces sp. NPDC045251]|uniref:peptidoglycan-binding protein n=1 Tax=unclassified Streptomyces TaxID=2593676 RepID=UPI0033EFC858